MNEHIFEKALVNLVKESTSKKEGYILALDIIRDQMRELTLTDDVHLANKSRAFLLEAIIALTNDAQDQEEILVEE